MFILKRNSICTGLFHVLLKNTAIKQNEAVSNRFRTLNIFSPQVFTSAPNADSFNIEDGNDQCEPIDFEAITKGSKELEHKLKVIMLEAEVLRQQGNHVPSHEYITSEMWENLMNSPSRSSRRKYLEFIFKISKKKEKRKLKKEEKEKHREEFRLANPLGLQKDLTLEEHAMTYALKYNSMFLRFYESTINRLYNKKLIEAMQFGQKIIIDCGYEENMAKKENIYCGKQLMLLFAENRFHVDPFDLHLVNFNKHGVTGQTLSKFIPTLYESDFPLNVHESSYLDMFPKEKLIYLTPHCKEDMKTFDHDAIYIIGGIVDKINSEPLSLAKAKRQGIKMLKFPLDKYLLWGTGSGKSLTLNQCVSILLDLKATGDWKQALKHVPRRKLASVQNEAKFKRELASRSTWRSKSNV